MKISFKFKALILCSLGLILIVGGQKQCYYITFSRPFGSHDTMEDISEPSTQELVWAFGSTVDGADEYHDRNRGHVELGNVLHPDAALKNKNYFHAAGTDFYSTRYDYTMLVKEDILQVFWSCNEGKIDFALEFCKKEGWEGWVGVGLSPDGHMHGMDATMISVPSCAYTDRWGVSDYATPVIDQKQDVLNFECNVSSEQIAVEKNIAPAEKEIAERERLPQSARPRQPQSARPRQPQSARPRQPQSTRPRSEKQPRTRTQQAQRRPNPVQFQVYEDSP